MTPPLYLIHCQGYGSRVRQQQVPYLHDNYRAGLKGGGQVVIIVFLDLPGCSLANNHAFLPISAFLMQITHRICCLLAHIRHTIHFAVNRIKEQSDLSNNTKFGTFATYRSCYTGCCVGRLTLPPPPPTIVSKELFNPLSVSGVGNSVEKFHDHSPLLQGDSVGPISGFG